MTLRSLNRLSGGIHDLEEYKLFHLGVSKGCGVILPVEKPVQLVESESMCPELVSWFVGFVRSINTGCRVRLLYLLVGR